MINIKCCDGEAKIFTPYNKEFITNIKTIGAAKWNPREGCWVVPESSVDLVRDFMLKIYGYSDISDNEQVDIRVTFNKEYYEERESIYLFGKVIARAFGRDSGAKIGNDVTLLDGRVYSGGSIKYWTTNIEAGTKMIIRNVSKKLLEEYDFEDETFLSIEKLETAPNKKKLIEEKNQLLKRITEIDKQLEKIAIN